MDDQAQQLLAGSRPFIERQVRSLRRGRIDWTLSTSELTAEVTARAWKALGKRPDPIDPAHFRSLVARIAITTFAQAVRTAMRVRARLAMAAARSDGGSPPEPQLTASHREEVQRLAESLAAEEVLVWMLRAEGESWETIARRLSITPGAARQRWSQLRAKVARWHACGRPD